MSALPYATDEDVYLQAPGDYFLLCPSGQVLAEGEDGVIASGTPWMFASSSVDFSVNGVLQAPPLPPGVPAVPGTLPNSLMFGMPSPIISLTGGTPAGGDTALAISVVNTNTHSVTLRRPGLASGQGSPPGGTTGRTGVEFQVPTLAPQIERASNDLNMEFGIDELVYGRRTADLYDPREVRQACVFKVLIDLYDAMARQDKDDTFAGKAKVYRQHLGDLMARVSVAWKATTGADGVGMHTNRFSTRITR